LSKFQYFDGITTIPVKTIGYTGSRMFEKVYIIAEAGSNHNGDLETALQLVRTAKECGADAIKFQSFTLQGLFSPPHYEQVLDMHASWKEQINRISFKPAWIQPINVEAQRVGIRWFATPFSVPAVEMLAPHVPFFKISSGDLTFTYLIRAVAAKQKGVFISTGAATLHEIDRALEILAPYRLPFVCIMHCVMLYPPPVSSLNLNFIDTLKTRYGFPIGLSDHTKGYEASLVCLGKGIAAVEKHFTLDSTRDGADHKNSLDPEQFGQFVQVIRTGEKMAGTGKKKVSKKEARERIFARRGIYTATAIKQGEQFTREKLRFLRPNTGIGADCIDSVLGSRAAEDIEEGAVLKESMIEHRTETERI
jgi:N,N'-diacetyllegionaminate synthase